MTFSGPPEPYARVEPVSTCDPTPKAGVLAFRDWVLANWKGRTGGIARDCELGPPSKHHEGRAWDWFPPDRSTATEFLEALLADDADGQPEALARRTGMRSIIYSGAIWRAGIGWDAYTGDPHDDHVHFGFGWAGAEGKTSFYRRTEGGALRVAPFCPGLDDGSRCALSGKEPLSEHERDAPSEPAVEPAGEFFEGTDIYEGNNDDE